VYDLKSRMERMMEPSDWVKVTVSCAAYEVIMFSVWDLMFRELESMLKMKER